MAELVQKMDGIKYDILIGGTAVTHLVKNINLAAGASDGSQEADCILCDDVDATQAVVATAYYRGLFNREGIIVAESDTVEAHEEELRIRGIFLTKCIL